MDFYTIGSLNESTIYNWPYSAKLIDNQIITFINLP